jgi:hypothetical protein
MNETKAIETKPKKMVSRNVALAFGIICILLASGLIASNIILASVINDKENTISSLTIQVNSLQNNITNMEEQIYDLNMSLMLQTPVPLFGTENNGVINFNLVPNSYTSWNFSISYAGAFIIAVGAPLSALDYSYVRVLWNSLGMKFDEQINGSSRPIDSGLINADFPVLPGSVQVIVGNNITEAGIVSGQIPYSIQIVYLY